MQQIRQTLAILTVWLVAWQAAGAEEPAEHVQWLTGDKLHAQLEQKVGATWSGLPLRQALSSLARSQRTAILLDRRVDPDQKIEMSFDDVTLDAALKLVAAREQIGMAVVGSTIYLGPPKTAERIRTLAALRKDETRSLSAAARGHFLEVHPWHWDDLAAPSDILSGLATQCSIRINGREKIPHDLWAAADLPAMNFIDRLTLVAAEFDQTFEIGSDGRSVQLVDMPETVVLERSYPLRGAIAEKANEISRKLTESLPEAKIELTGGKLLVRGRAEDHDFVETLLAGAPAKRTTVSPGQKVYTLAIKMPVGTLVKKLGEKLELEVRLDEPAIQAAGLSLTTEVNVNVKEATADELLKAVLAPAGLTFSRHDKVIDVHPAKK